MNDAEWERLVGEAEEYFDDVTLKRGFQYYKQGRVVSLKEKRGTLEAIVEGNKNYRVVVDVDFFGTSLCNCPVDDYCKHMAAVLMMYADQQGRSVQELANAAARIEIPSIKTAVSAATPKKVNLADRSKRNSLEANKLAHGNVAMWHDWLRSCTESVTDMTRNPYFAKQALTTIYSYKPSMPKSVEPIFHFHVLLHVLERLFSPGGSSGPTAYLGYYTQIAVSEIMQEMTTILRETLPAAGDDSRRQIELLSETADYVRIRMAKKSSYSLAFSTLYGMLWRKWLPGTAAGNASERYRDELAKLAVERKRPGSELEGLSVLLAEARMHYRLGEDPEARRLLESASRYREERGDTVLEFMRDMLHLGEWERLREWLDETAVIIAAERGAVDAYFQLWDAYVDEVPEAVDAMWERLIGMLPTTSSLYEEKLQQFGRWAEWLDYQLSIGTDPLELRATELKPAETEAPELLLPFYHQAVERYVLLRNRDGYKAAAKILKRLAKVYKKIKREDRWNSFLAAFSAKHSRLRALQEELRKGKLLT